MAELQCERQIPEIKELKDQEITVGRHIILQCSGEIDSGFNIKEAQFQLDEKNKYTVQVLKAAFKSNSHIEIDMTFYSAGEFKFPDLVLEDGKNELHLGSQNFKVETVIEKKSDGKLPEPFGPIFPASLAWPAIYTLIVVVTALVFLSFGLWLIKKRLHYRKLIAQLKNYESSVSADLQFYRSLRSLEARNYPLKDLEKAFRLYILRSYQVPALELKDSELLSFFKKNNPWLKKERLEIKKFLSDFQLIQNKSTDPNNKEVISLTKSLLQKMYHFVDHTEALLKRTKPS